MVAGFNGCFKLHDHVGGYYYNGTTVAPLRDGLVALVIHTDGSLAIGVWGRDLTMTSDVSVVRENMGPLVDGGVARALATDGPRVWGYANGGRALANRSALGTRPDGSLIFAYGHSLAASTLADILVSTGVTEAMILDMNRTWPTGFTYTHVGGKVQGAKINPNIVRPPSTYLTRFRKDFVAVEAI